MIDSDSGRLRPAERFATEGRKGARRDDLIVIRETKARLARVVQTTHWRGRGRPVLVRGRYSRTPQEGEGRLRGTYGQYRKGSRRSRQVWKPEGEEEPDDREFIDEQGEEEEQADHDGCAVSYF